jgi:hypothetical protein
MKVWRICLTAVGFGLLLLLVSCSKKEVTKDDTEGFLAGLSTMFGQAMMTEANQMIVDLSGKNPPTPGIPELPGLGSYDSKLVAELSEGKLRAPYDIDTLYGTWRYDTLSESWDFVDPGNPANAILLEWVYLDTNEVAHDAAMRFDSLEFFEDSLPENLWIGIKIDDDITWLAWLKLEATYVSLEQVSAVSLIYEIVGYYQVGVSISSPTAIDSNFDGTVHLWVIDRTSNNYRVDLTVTVNDGGDSGELVLEDSDGWKMDLDISEVVETDGEFEMRNVSGEITRDGAHAADIDGHIWDPEDGTTHVTEITVTFADGSIGDLLTYISEGLLDVGD